MNYDNNEKRIAYIRLRSKMESILNKSIGLNTKEADLGSALKVSLTVDDNIFENEAFKSITNNTEELITDIHQTISNINSHI